MLVYDIQDVGSRYYTFLSTLAYLIEDCAGAGKRLVVLDRPDPLGGEIIEGTTCAPVWRALWAAIRSPLATP